ncbi:carboxymuconolactone decarboxylase family protein [Brevibacillus porteri]|nr:carboxymuconolactone decarboxylase family protein [Brevibacillus porteri]MED1801112.1 carboxymuconolactone decarboxylase family protein [Brevibacillus porteri]MED2131719.1 carboxymuconolactone decarboxylase family protein [Brevibacillus porteri]MED2743507.1 carboxymuconolactone decarboxylase family protein [Brevibacillus porteri]MED2817579.1 carboxymuconolactone decarboxylase family protein [Brevibacillus porteri]MED2897309.1 carboxymuconolactone decarboxylase family protein [Brevibacillus 
MQARFNHRAANPEAYQTMLKLENFVNESGLDKKLIELIKIRASQINGCAFCMDMHTQDARKLGETEQRIYLLSLWRESAVYTEAERTVLALTEAVTVITANGVSEELYQQVREHFDENQYVALIMAINTINSWNRIAISTGMSAPYNK